MSYLTVGYNKSEIDSYWVGTKRIDLRQSNVSFVIIV